MLPGWRGTGRLNPCFDARLRQAHPPAFARRLPDGGTATGHGPRREEQRRGLREHGRRGVRPPLLRRSLRAAGPGGADHVRPRRVHRRGAVQPAPGALLPAADRPHRRRAGGAADQLLPARGPVRLRRAAAPGAAEPGAGPREHRRSRPQDGHHRPARQRLHARDLAAAGQAGAGHQQAAHDPLHLLDGAQQRHRRAHHQPLRSVRAARRLVRGRRRLQPGGPGGQKDVPHLAHARRDQVRNPARAGLPDPGRLQRHRVPRSQAVAAGARAGRRRAAGGLGRRHLAGEPAVRRSRRLRGARGRQRHAHHRVLQPRGAVAGGAADGGPHAAARAGRAGGDGAVRPRPPGGAAHGRPQPAGQAVARPRRRRRCPRRALPHAGPGGAGAVRAPAGAARVPARALRR